MKKKKEGKSNGETRLANEGALRRHLSKQNPTKVLETLIQQLKVDYQFSDDDILALVNKEDEILIPVSLFTHNPCTVLQATVKFLKDERFLSFSEIGKQLNRNERSIWGTYKGASEALGGNLILRPSKLFVPMSVFAKEQLSALESVVTFLKEHHHLQLSVIAKLLSRDNRTIWTVYDRAKKKRGGDSDA
ncbi:hypothetical protein CL622_05305 [archaeon]|nr:hypothetical protein [archaeon]